jgi:hypothetical protein
MHITQLPPVSLRKVANRLRLLTLVWKWKSNDTADAPCAQKSVQQSDENGFWSDNGNYLLRPGNDGFCFNLTP